MANVDEDGEREVPIGSRARTVYCFSASGRLDWVFSYEQGDTQFAYYILGASIVSADLGDDSKHELTVPMGSLDRKVFCTNVAIGLECNCGNESVDHLGELISNFTTGDTVRYRIAVADINVC